jgi:hypothetical protein
MPRLLPCLAAMLAVVKAAGVGPAGRRLLVLRCVASMRKSCIQTGRPEAVKLTTNDEGADCYAFEMSAVDDRMAEAGTAIIDAHKTLHARSPPTESIVAGGLRRAESDLQHRPLHLEADRRMAA